MQCNLAISRAAHLLRQCARDEALSAVSEQVGPVPEFSVRDVRPPRLVEDSATISGGMIGMKKDVCFNDLGCFLRSWNAEVWQSVGKSSVRRKLWGRLEGAALYGSSKAY